MNKKGMVLCCEKNVLQQLLIKTRVLVYLIQGPTSMFIQCNVYTWNENNVFPEYLKYVYAILFI